MSPRRSDSDFKFLRSLPVLLANSGSNSSNGSESTRARALLTRATHLATPPSRLPRLSDGPLFDAVCVDAFGTLLNTVEPVHVTYADISRKHGEARRRARWIRAVLCCLQILKR